LGRRRGWRVIFSGRGGWGWAVLVEHHGRRERLGILCIDILPFIEMQQRALEHIVMVKEVGSIKPC